MRRLRRLPVWIGKGVLIVLLAEIVLQLTGRLYYATHRHFLQPPSETAATADFVILFVGESTTAGDGAEDLRTGPFPAQLEVLLERRFPGMDFACVNLGLKGTTTPYLLNKLKTDLDAYRPDLVVIQAGNNLPAPHFMLVPVVRLGKWTWEDVVFFLQRSRIYRFCRLVGEILWRGGSERLYKAVNDNEDIPRRMRSLLVHHSVADIRNMVRTARRQGVKPVLCNYFESRSNPFLARLAAELDVPLCDNQLVFGRLLKRGEARNYLSADGWHPNTAGYRLIAENLLRTLIEKGLLPRTPPRSGAA
ncbi:MAG TPA: GDSL-type esterase/lipase family protein [Elusimicrobiota bacterium]|nr:GDSL-type esterase/lipase family protein [Elusimicrobiota bacterium]